MTLFLQKYFIISLFVFLCFCLSVIIIFFSYRVSIFNPDVEKLSVYECGFDPYDDARNKFDVRFYLVAILFLIFDLETIYFFPACFSFSFFTSDAMFFLLDFIFELFLGFVYAWIVGALEWE